MYRRKLVVLDWKRRTMVICALIILSMVLLIGSVLKLATGRTEARTTSSSDGDPAVHATGLLQATIYNLNFQNTGIAISEIDVAQGQTVTRGEVLARQDASTLKNAVNIAQITVNTARRNLDSTKEYAKQVTIFRQAQIDAAQTAISVNEDNKNAVNHQSDVSIEGAEKKLEADQRVLDATRKAYHEVIAAAKAQLNQNLAACDPPPTPAPTQTPTPDPTPAPAQTPTPGPAPSPAQMPTPGSTPVLKQTGAAQASEWSASVMSVLSKTTQLCKQIAHAQFESVEQLAQLEIIKAQRDVTDDKQDLELAKATANANNTNARGQVKIAKKQLDVAKDTPDEANARLQVTEAQGQLDTAIAQLNAAKDNLSSAVLVAPHNGVVTVINGAVGAVPGQRTNIVDGFSSADGGTFIQITDVGSVRQVLTDVNETDILKVQDGQSVRFTLKAFGDRVFSGTVTGISPNGIFNGSSSVYPVIVTIDPQSTTGATLLPNMSADVTILT
jgi:multidrug efflux pump subunit AcrA (membrane-fusion protein)